MVTPAAPLIDANTAATNAAQVALAGTREELTRARIEIAEKMATVTEARRWMEKREDETTLRIDRLEHPKPQ